MTGNSTSNPSTSTQTQQWILLRDNQHVGPLTPKQLKHLADTQQITPDDLLWREGLDEWIPAKRLPQLWTAALQSAITPPFKSPPPPIPAPGPSRSTPSPTREPEAEIPVLQPAGIRTIQVQEKTKPTRKRRAKQASAQSAASAPSKLARKVSPAPVKLRFRQTGSVIVFVIASFICGVLHLPITIVAAIAILSAPFAGIAAFSELSTTGGGMVAAAFGMGAIGLAVAYFLVGFVYIVLTFCCLVSGIGLAMNRSWGGWFGLGAGACSAAIALQHAWSVWSQFNLWRMTQLGRAKEIKEGLDTQSIFDSMLLAAALFSLMLMLLYGGYATLAFRSIFSARYYEEPVD
ncbi:DUF4339 domain-containing protein [Roseiconus lacunae]|uniref:DUF4339 domain-containing protein n=1 Tax=Roseiconus lacunae TaxID=2605694 RepID=UPI001E2BFB72|nr:DUF4339 domain-containing protein [Roseiconus lacunae]MCD0462133.1 DUF4339 domain-containing protein [Roseiconus lacunae]